MAARFVIRVPDHELAVLRELTTMPVADAMADAYRRLSSRRDFIAPANWCLQTYLHMCAAGHEVSLGAEPVPGTVNVVAIDDLDTSPRGRSKFVAVVRHDRGRPHLGAAAIVQNVENVAGPNDHFVPHWPQPGIIERDITRAQAIRTVSYKGMPGDLAAGFAEHLAPELRRRGLELEISPSGDDDHARWSHWCDYREVDVVVALRDDPPPVLATKPASKLVNAWMAGVPAILGPEPAYRALRRSGLDYLEVDSAEGALAALDRLRDDPDLYAAIVRNGRERSAEVDSGAVSRRWVEVLELLERQRLGWNPPPMARWAVARLRHRRAYRGYWAHYQRPYRPGGEPQR